MPPKEFLKLAMRLAYESSEASWRSAISRAYYAIFHEVRNRLATWGFAMRQSDQAHAGLTRRLLNSQNEKLIKLGNLLTDLKRYRNFSDYDLGRKVLQTDALIHVQRIEQSFESFVILSRDQEREVIDNIRRYERDVLREVTWQSPN